MSERTTSISRDGDSITRLKRLLFDAEAQRLAEVQARLETLTTTHAERQSEVAQRQAELARRLEVVFERAGTEERLQKSVASILDGALRDAEVTRHEPLSRAVAPLVVKTIKTELRNSEAELVDALYPHTGKMVRQYVRVAMAELLADIERKLGGAKPSELDARARALGISVAELVLRESQQLKIDELFLVRRGSGELVAHWERPADGLPAGPPSGANRDVLIAGYLSGIQSFSEEAFDDRKGSLRALDMGGERILVRASPAYLLAARCSGTAPAAVDRIVDEAFVETLSQYRAALTATPATDPAGTSLAHLLPALATRCERDLAAARSALEADARQAMKPRGRGRLYALLALLLLPLLAWFAWSTWQSWNTRRVQTAAERVLAESPGLRGFPVRADVSSGGGQLALRGLVPDQTTRRQVTARVAEAVPGTAVRDELGSLPEPVRPAIDLPPDTSRDVALLRDALAAARQQLTQTSERLAQVAAAAARLPEVEAKAQADARAARTAISELERQLDLLRRQPPPAGGPTPLAALNEYLRTHAIFFANGTDWLDDASAASTIEGLLPRLLATDASLRIVGYTDERGQTQANAALATARAERVAAVLVERGIARERLITLGRTTGPDLARGTGVGSANRRVEFELGFVGEPRSP
jgi:outer membrane protein OmpA-like peptidoglycan-associated protein